MSISVDWHDESHAIVEVNFKGNWTVEQFVAAFAQATELVNSTDRPVSVVVDARENAGIPRDCNLIPHFRTVLGSGFYEYIVFVGGSPFGIALVKVVMRIIPNRTQHVAFADTFDEAITMIENLRVKA